MSIWSTVIFPIFPLASRTAVIAFGIRVAMNLQSVILSIGWVNKVGPECKCSGPAIGYNVVKTKVILLHLIWIFRE